MNLFIKLAISGLALGSIYSLISIGYGLIYKSSGLMSFAQGDILTLGAFVGLFFFKDLGLPWIVAVLLTMVVMFFFGILLEKGIIRKLLNKNVSAIYIVLATIALSSIMQNGMQIVFGTVPKAFPSIFSTPVLDVFGAPVQKEMILCFGAGLILMVLLHLFMNKTSFGTAMRAASMDPMAAESCGINVSWTTGVTWGLSAGIAAIGGIFLGPMYGVYVVLGANIARKGFAGAVIGGYGNMYGAMVGGLLLGVVETLLAGYVSTELKNLLAYTILILFLFLKPTGIFNERAIQDV